MARNRPSSGTPWSAPGLTELEGRVSDIIEDWLGLVAHTSRLIRTLCLERFIINAVSGWDIPSRDSDALQKTVQFLQIWHSTLPQLLGSMASPKNKHR